jgi:transposase
MIGFEATGNYHRALAHHLLRQGFELRTISSLAVARTREALYNSWDKNDPKDAQVILHLLKSGTTQTYYDPLASGFNDIQEISMTYHQISLRKTRVQHSILTHFLPLYFPEAQKYLCSSRAEWFSEIMLKFPCPAAVLKYSKDEFLVAAWPEVGRKVNKGAWLNDFYETARDSIGLPVSEDSVAIAMFRVILREHNHICRIRRELEACAEQYLKGNMDYKRLQTIPGVGPIVALIILAEAGDLRRFSHHRKFLKFCGFDLSTQQSGAFRGTSRLSKHGNARLRYAFWIAATVAIRMRENTLRKKYDRYVASDPKHPDLKRKAFTAVAAKIARVAYALIKEGTDYRCYYESSVPSGRIPSHGPLRRLTS